MKKLELNIPELPFAAEEAMNRLRINITFVGENTRKIMVTSSIENEGKSTVSVYLWKMLAEAGHKVLLIDLDLRKSVIRNRFYSTDSKMLGMEHYLSGMAELQDVVFSTSIENADIIPCINPIKNPSNLFDDPRLVELLDQMKNEYRYIIIDTPPILAVSDGLQIARLCDGALMVVRSGETPKKMIRAALNAIEEADCPVLGTVLNMVPVSARKYGYYKYGYSKYGYGYGYGQK